MSNATITDSAANASSTGVPSKKSGASKLVVLLLVIAAAMIGAWALGEELTLTKLAARESAFRQFQAGCAA